MITGVCISRHVDASRRKIGILFALLSVLDIYCTFNEIRSVVFNTFNFERANIALRRIFAGAAPSAVTPYAVTFGENLLLPSQFDENMFVGWSDLPLHSCSREFVESSLNTFTTDRFVVCLNAVFRPRLGWWRERNAVDVLWGAENTRVRLRPRVLLRESATATDTLLALIVVHKIMHQAQTDAAASRDRIAVHKTGHEVLMTAGFDERGLLARAAVGAVYARDNAGRLLDVLRSVGWDMDRFMFGNITSRIL